MNTLTIDVLDAIQGGYVTQYPNDVYQLPASAYDSPEQAQEYRQTVLLLLSRGWAMPTRATGNRGEYVLRLTSIGEQRLIEARAGVLA